MGFIKKVILVGIIVAIVGLVAYDATREAMKNFFIYTVAPVVTSAHASIVQSEWWHLYQLYIVVPPVFVLGLVLSALYYKGKITMWQWGAKKAVETAYGTKQPAPAPTPLASVPATPPEQKQEAAA